MKKLFGLVAAGVLMVAPAFAQTISVSTNQMAAPKSGDHVTVCASMDASVPKSIVGLGLLFSFPTGWTVMPSDPTDDSSAFTNGPNVPPAALAQAKYDAMANTYNIGFVSSKPAPAGPGQIGCFDLIASATAAAGPIGLVVSANDKNAQDVTVKVMGATLQGAAPTTGGTATTATATTATATTATATTATATTATATTATATTTGGACTPAVAHKSGQIDITDVSAKANDTVTVAVNVSKDLVGLAGIGLTVNYDPKVFTFMSSDPTDASADFATGDAFKKGKAPLLQVNGSTAGQLVIGIVSSPATVGGGNLFTFPLKVNAAAANGSQSEITLTNVALNDSMAATVNGTVGNGVVTIGTCGGGTTTATTATATTATATTATATTATATTATATTATATTTGGACTPAVAHKAGQIDITDVSAAPGQTIMVAVNVSKDVTGLAGVGMTVNYDPKVFTFKSSDPTDASADFTTGPIFKKAPLLQVNGSTAGQLVVGIVASPASSSGGNIFTFPLTVVQNPPSNPAQSEITLTNVALNDSMAKTVNSTVGNGVVTIGTCGGTTTTAGMTTTTGMTTTGGLGPHSGDVSGNGKLDIQDVRDAINILFGLDTDPAHIAAATISGDATVSLADIRMILQAVVKANGG